ncbi:uncharacterized protein ARMOST_01730 [Armillaria ostoyae]|uniref:Uncharacterized protein n=1 Tax=Armillaria ostoyae TaxID=47428 RepID=A0A284QPQ4_ARMOS|nr:uncharacterized protein ARMOST_01730 [Armillaria ostoyae]
MAPPESLSFLGSLSRPSDLFTSTAPYILTVSLRDQPELPSLIRWAKAHSMTLTLVESDFYPRMMDSLVVKPNLSWDRNGKLLNPTIVLAFIEGVVGYRMVYTTGSYWMYRRTTLFKYSCRNGLTDRELG